MGTDCVWNPGQLLCRQYWTRWTNRLTQDGSFLSSLALLPKLWSLYYAEFAACIGHQSPGTSPVVSLVKWILKESCQGWMFLKGNKQHYLERKSLFRGCLPTASLLLYLGQKPILRSLAELGLSPTETCIAESGPLVFQLLVGRTGGNLNTDALTGKPPPWAGALFGSPGPRPGTWDELITLQAGASCLRARM